MKKCSYDVDWTYGRRTDRQTLRGELFPECSTRQSWNMWRIINCWIIWQRLQARSKKNVRIYMFINAIRAKKSLKQNFVSLHNLLAYWCEMRYFFNSKYTII